MKERPILFQGAMVRALLDGSKTQTRRIVKSQPPEGEPIQSGLYHPTRTHRDGEQYPGDEVCGAYTQDGEWALPCPYGQPGDRLWVRETFTAMPRKAAALYRADHLFEHMPKGDLGRDWNWTPSIFMPRWASRILLEIVSVRVERLNDISEADAVAEGLTSTADDAAWHVEHEQHRAVNPVDSYASLWESINGAGSWDANPWVWCIEFKRVPA